MSKKYAFALLVMIAALFLSGCGYHNPYASPSGKELPVAGIHLKMWENRTNELGLESMMSQALADWLIQSRHLLLKANAAEADYELSGVLISTNDAGSSYDVHDQVQTLKVLIHMAFTLREAKTGRVIWEVADSAREASFNAGPNTVATRGNKQKALATLVSETAEDIYLRIFYTMTKKINATQK